MNIWATGKQLKHQLFTTWKCSRFMKLVRRKLSTPVMQHPLTMKFSTQQQIRLFPFRFRAVKPWFELQLFLQMQYFHDFKSRMRNYILNFYSWSLFWWVWPWRTIKIMLNEPNYFSEHDFVITSISLCNIE